MAYTNVDGLVSALLEVNDYLREFKPDIMCFTETKLSEDTFVQLGGENYRTWRRDRKNMGGGGVMIVAKNCIKIDSVELSEGKAEAITLKLADKGKGKRVITVAYVPPKTRAWSNTDYQQMLADTTHYLKKVIKESDNIITLGDFNCKEVNWEEWETESETSWGNTLLNIAMSNVMTQWIQEPTRYRGDDTPARLDLLLTKEPDVIEALQYKCPIGKSDHVMIEFQVSEGSAAPRDEAHRKDRFNFGKTNFTGLRRYFNEADWRSFNESSEIEIKWQIFLSIYNTGLDKYVPKLGERGKWKEDWFNKKCEKAKEVRDAAWKTWRKRGTSRTKEEYKTARNEYVRIRREEQKNFERDIIDRCKDEPKLFYRYVNGKLKHKEGISKLKFEGEVYDDAAEQAEIMNKCFQSVFSIESEFTGRETASRNAILDDIQVEVQEIHKLLGELEVRKATGPDGVSNWILRECKDQLADKIHSLIECSLKEGKVPLDWKRANVVPIFKSGKKEEPLNYRPVSLTSLVAKLCERVFKERWSKYLEEMNIITERQFGFRGGRSCVTNLLSFYSRVIDAVQERDGWADCIYLDLEKAFDKVPHNRLMWKLENIGGLKGNLLNWMKDFLENREMRTVIKGKMSGWRKVTSGVPQGSVLAPVMFLIYVNDMVEGVSSYTSLFADDAKIMRKIETIADSRALQDDLNILYNWSQTWGMKFNAKKCKSLEMGSSARRPTTVYTLGQDHITKTTEEKDLGVIIQDNLSPNKHINKIVRETYSLLKNIRVAFHYLDEEMVKKLIVSMIRPRLEYAVVVWSPHKKKDINKIERIQRAATKMIPSLKDVPYEERLKRLGLPTLKERRERGDMIAVFRATIGAENIDRDDLFLWNEGPTRGHDRKLRKTRCLRDVKKYSFPYRSVDRWNNLDKEIVHSKTMHEFKTKLDRARLQDRTPRA